MLLVSCHHRNVFLINVSLGSRLISYALTLVSSLMLYLLLSYYTTAVTFIDNDIYTKYFKKELSFIEYVNIFDSLSLLLFGMGLW